MGQIITDKFDFSAVTPSEYPPAGSYIVAFDIADDELKKMDSSGTLTVISGGGGGGDNFANADLTFDATHNHNVAGFDLNIGSQGNAGGNLYFGDWDGSTTRFFNNITLSADGAVIIDSPSTTLNSSALSIPNAGTPDVGKVLTSDGVGNATWETPGGDGDNLYAEGEGTQSLLINGTDPIEVPDDTIVRYTFDVLCFNVTEGYYLELVGGSVFAKNAGGVIVSINSSYPGFTSSDDPFANLQLNLVQNITNVGNAIVIEIDTTGANPGDTIRYSGILKKVAQVSIV